MKDKQNVLLIKKKPHSVKINKEHAKYVKGFYVDFHPSGIQIQDTPFALTQTSIRI